MTLWKVAPYQSGSGMERTTRRVETVFIGHHLFGKYAKAMALMSADVRKI